MSGFRATTAGVTIKLRAEDALLLADLARQLAALIAGREIGVGGRDPALARLLPAAYLDNEDDAAEFRRFTEDELADEKLRNAERVAEALEVEQVDGSVRVKLDAAAAFAWLRSFTDIRLALAAKLGIENSDSPPPVLEDIDEQERLTYAIYFWLGELQWSLVKAVDR